MRWTPYKQLQENLNFFCLLAKPYENITDHQKKKKKTKSKTETKLNKPKNKTHTHTLAHTYKNNGKTLYCCLILKR